MEHFHKAHLKFMVDFNIFFATISQAIDRLYLHQLIIKSMLEELVKNCLLLKQGSTTYRNLGD